jgi:hypothetical protein
MRLLELGYVLTLGAGLGLGSAHWAVAERPVLGKVTIGPWQSWPSAGARAIDPYMRAHLARNVLLPLGAGEGLELLAESDEAGRPLTASCRYRITGATPPARGWTLTVTAGDGPAAGPAAPRSGFSDAEIVRDEAGALLVTAGTLPEPGNWLPLPRDGRFQLRLRLYDTPVSTHADALRLDALPAVTRIDCP